jgi:hypothetical protein
MVIRSGPSAIRKAKLVAVALRGVGELLQDPEPLE